MAKITKAHLLAAMRSVPDNKLPIAAEGIRAIVNISNEKKKSGDDVPPQMTEAATRARFEGFAERNGIVAPELTFVDGWLEITPALILWFDATGASMDPLIRGDAVPA